LVTADRAGGIHLWDANSGKILLSFLEHKEAVRALDWRIDSKVLASMGEDGRLIWWDVTDGFPATSKTNAHPPKRPAGVYGRIPNGVLAGRFDQKGNLVTTGRDQVVRLWDPNGNQKKSFTIESGIPISSSIANEGKTVISGDSAGLVRFWRSE
jgi:WD40 repeat protein